VTKDKDGTYCTYLLPKTRCNYSYSKKSNYKMDVNSKLMLQAKRKSSIKNDKL